jgi:hypothetical protein
MVVIDVDRVPGPTGGHLPSDPPEARRARPVALPQGHLQHRPAGPDAWEPLAGPALLDRLRITGRPRPTADPELVVMLRHGLEEGLLSEGGGQSPRGGPTGLAEPPLVVTKDRLTRALSSDARRRDVEFGQRLPTVSMACGAMVDVLFRQLVTVGSIGDPTADALAALSIDDRQRELVTWIECLPKSEVAELRAEVERQADGLVRRWPKLDAAWLPRTQEALRVGLAVGRPAQQRASVAIVEIKSGARRIEHRADLHFYALVEALRNPAPPFVVATYYTRTGELDVDPVTEELLVAASQRTLAGIRALLPDRESGRR